MKLLLTAFDPFGGEKINPALEAVKRVQDKIGDLEIVKLEVFSINQLIQLQMRLKKNILMSFYVLDKQVEDLT